jgi:hypothetical protein
MTTSNHQSDRAQLRAAPVVLAGDRDLYAALLGLRRGSPGRPALPDHARAGGAGAQAQPRDPATDRSAPTSCTRQPRGR